MRIIEQADLSRCNTLGLPGRARFLARIDNEADLQAVLTSVTASNLPLTVLGGGSNIVLAGDVPGLMVQMAIPGLRLVSERGSEVIVEAGGGENWHGFTRRTLAMGLGGLENLSLIPGTVGASPVQNIGAYGVELKDVMHSLTAFDRISRRFVEFTAADCVFAYRDSVFKSGEPGRHVISRVRFRLSRQPQLKTDYGDIRQALAARQITQPTAADVARAVIAIRQSKLPDPAQLGNAGSFFKNPVVPLAQAEALKARWPGLVAYAQPAGVQPEGAKLAAGWLIEQAGWKGLQRGAVGVHDRQALVLVHRGGGSGVELLKLASDIRASVFEKFGVALEQEPVILGQ